MFHVSVIAPNATTVVYGILFGGMHSENPPTDTGAGFRTHSDINNEQCMW